MNDLYLEHDTHASYEWEELAGKCSTCYSLVSSYISPKGHPRFGDIGRKELIEDRDGVICGSPVGGWERHE